ncbi:hypothetical protein ASAC_0425 [Acidilobus saccharovorans 345-15]|uniref:Uncharacterized protein n=1 Tax=Acidilobus saccharovorans (strain DSM 16705 / JCM 18335 / VKM B-2471 / 345-15) TaxID=666510 RepID=D9Q0J4_ACIS3|nr:hypothetical protein ASAC_0425 [Acidilobus saccharovorans 345-15]
MTASGRSINEGSCSMYLPALKELSARFRSETIDPAVGA